MPIERCGSPTFASDCSRIAQFPQLREIRPRMFRFWCEWGHRHQPLNVQSIKAKNFVQLRAKICGRESKLARLSRNVDFQQYARTMPIFGCNPLELLRQFQGIQAVEQLEKRQRPPGSCFSANAR